jgi:hypothetical protein
VAARVRAVGIPPALATLLLLPPFTFLLPLYAVLARMPDDRELRLASLPRPQARRPVPVAVAGGAPRPPARPASVGLEGKELGFNDQGPLRLDSNGLPRYRIPLLPSTSEVTWPDVRRL